MEDFDFLGSSDLDFIGEFEKRDFDYSQLPEDGQNRFTSMMSSGGGEKDQALSSAAMTPDKLAIGLSQGKSKDMSQPAVQQQNLPGLMSMATQGIQKITKKRQGLMEY